MTNWYAVYTRPNCEKKVAESFAKRKIESYVPFNKIVRQWTGKKVLQMPLFPSYVFVRLCESQLPIVKTIDGIINLVCWLGTPAIIRDVEIDMIQRFLSVHEQVQLEKTAVNVSEMVKLMNVPLKEKQGDFVSLRSNRVKLLLPSLGYFIVAEGGKEHIETAIPSTIWQQQNLSLQ